MGIIGSILAGIISLAIFCASATVVLAIVVPFIGIVVRFRVNYNPRALSLGPGGDAIGVPDGGEDGRVVGPRVTSLLGMFLRVRRIEGWKGLYKGYMPLLLYTMGNTLFSLVWTGSKAHSPKGGYSIPRATMFQSLVYALFMALIALPFGILTNRAITTPHKLPMFSPRVSLKLLLTAYERRRPWVLYMTPGLLVAQTLHVAFVTLVFRVVRVLLVPALAYGLDGAEEDGTLSKISTVKLSIFILFQALAGTAILCPLEVVSERLSVQRNYTPGAEFEEEDAELAAAQSGETGVEYIGQGEDVLNLRSASGEEPYKGLRHTLNRIMEEEGVSTLFRAWWLTMLGAVLSGLA
ncbi:hypothetical protein FS837_008538 [Tulasnella sp. UAMH 9824]|nr:hypothetical protein FS837_008538 [Tulasnella sp. UAMH 9824]